MADLTSTVYDGSLLLAAPIALLAGLISFLSPCVLPLVPGYLGYVTGLSGTELEQGRRSRVVPAVLLFILGFSAVFVLAGLLFGQVFLWLRGEGEWLTRVLGVVVIIMGLGFLGAFPWLQNEAKIRWQPPRGAVGAPLLGAIFALGWAPCMGPTLATVIALSYGSEASVWRSGFLALMYCFGIGIPFLLIALGVKQGFARLKALRRHRRTIMVTGGAMLVLLGILMALGLWNQWMERLQFLFINSYTTPL